MIVKMMKYNIVLFAPEQERFIERLRELGMVDITTSGWEPSEEDRQLLAEIDARQKALAALAEFAAGDNYVAGSEAVSAGEAYAVYAGAQGEIAAARAEIARRQKVLDEWGAWGDFSVETIARLAEGGITLRYLVMQSAVYEKHAAELAERCNAVLISNEGGMARVVLVDDGSIENVALEAQELKAPVMSLADAKEAIAAQLQAIARCYTCLSACADAKAGIEAELAALKTRLQNVRIAATADNAADGLLLVMEAWAEEANAAEVDAALDAYPNVVYVKQKPTPEDNTPVKLKNNAFARAFELIGAMYALPKYGTIDLTPLFGPFYMLFFAICLCDAGYGLILLAAGLGLWFKGGASMRQAAKLSLFCAGATVLFGLYTGSFFGVSLGSLAPLKDVPFLDFQGKFFGIALALGFVQILFAMAINIYATLRTFGFFHATSLMGWFIVVASGCLAVGLPMFDLTIPFFTTSSPAFYAAMGVGLVLMLLLNRPSWNIFGNFAVGLWDTYNNITGLLSDVLSYIRLFAIGLSGGVLALVFNDLALGLSGLDGADFSASPWWVIALQIVAASAILLVGHGINLFMSCISSFVHPMRLTFVEFFKNAGFEAGTRAFEPLQRVEK